ncbi:restriction endonuclease subunit S [Mycoplasma sp. CR]|uniref:restriction endonuclease subunit S n=1 Tax=Mycoplasma sp. CR TaxID=3401693 RepID=UPI003AB050E0
MHAKKLVPQIRFKGFEEEWKKSELSEYGKCNSGYGFPISEQGSNDGIPFYKVSDMNEKENQVYMNKAKNYVSEKSALNNGWKSIDELPAILFAKVGAAVFLNRKRIVDKPFLMDNNMMAFSSKNKLNSKFLYFIFQRINIPELIQCGALPSINANDISKYQISTSRSWIEQEKIGSLFSNLDSLITSQELKLQKLQAIKQSLLDKMFASNNEKVPKIRFKGFEEEWKITYLENLANIFRGLTYNPSSISNKGIRVLRSSNIDVDKFKVFLDDIFVKPSSINIPYCKNGDILITAACGSPQLIGKHAIIKNIHEKSAVHGGFMLLVRTTWPDFLNASMWTNWYKNYLKNDVNGGNGAIGNINASSLLRAKLLYPSDKEQEKIGIFFNNLDTLITAQETKLEKLNNIKKSLLEKMFC